MPKLETWQILCLVALLVVLINGGLILGFAQPGFREQILRLGKSFQSVRNPWQTEEEGLAELRRLVADLEEDEAGEGSDDNG